MGDIFSFPANTGTSCTWLPWNHILFQMANMFLVALYVGDFIKWKSGFHFNVFLRIVLLGCSICFSMWGFFVLCSRDTAGINFVFFLYNVAQLVYVCYKEWRPSPHTLLDEYHTKLYNKTFSTLSIPIFNTIYSSGVMCEVERGAMLDIRHVRSDKLSFIVSGKIIAVLKNGSHITLKTGDFLNVSHWHVVGDSYHISYIRQYLASTDTSLMVWTHSTLTDILSSSPSDQHSFSLILLHNTNNLLTNILNTFILSGNCEKSDLTVEKCSENIEKCTDYGENTEKCTDYGENTEKCTDYKHPEELQGQGFSNGNVDEHVKIVIDNVGDERVLEGCEVGLRRLRVLEGCEVGRLSSVNNTVLASSEDSVNDDEAPLLNCYTENETNL